uniref:BTB domain-containing protein n=1 Tax=Strongyloides papillosus TaxID=174720 RepID=A0A0N5C046_STREA
MLKILCKIQVIKCELENHDNPDTSKGVRIPQSKLVSDYGNMLDSPTFSDCIIKVGGTEIKVHKVVLTARSPVFYQIFNATSEKPQSNVIEIDDYRSYTLKAISENSLCNTLAIDNVLERYVLSDKYPTAELNECCQELILNKWDI